MNSVCSCDGPVIAASKSVDNNMCCLRRGVVVVPHGESSSSSRKVCGVARASMVDSYESSSDLVKRMERAWLISQIKFKSFSFFRTGSHFFLIGFSFLLIDWDLAIAFSSSKTAGDDGDSVPGLGKSKNPEHSGVTGESSRCVWRVGDDDELLREVRPSLISSFLRVCLRSWSLKGDRRGAVKSTGLRDGFEEESALVTGSLCVSLAKPVSFWTRSLKVFMSA
ncbi:hypothetical protein POTOM_026539 [Populus tomentosa]|uniref:Uncharacterized protein n=1 Tax=Populus tomentosa TaxID=118781 RepID=A0A8X8CY84_POPTO|nr:hypothetical protein POTOM_026539 [Populus tomentosa]